MKLSRTVGLGVAVLLASLLGATQVSGVESVALPNWLEKLQNELTGLKSLSAERFAKLREEVRSPGGKRGADTA
jgi:hypothetical protein